jgi:hypothetical protein
MQLYGTIVASPGSSPLQRDRWIELCKSHPNLAPVPPRVAHNPFKPGETMVVRAPGDTVRVVVSGRDLGSMGWALDDSPCINVWGEDRAIIAVVQEIALSLSAIFVEEVTPSA